MRSCASGTAAGPIAGSIVSVKILSGVSCATFSMSMPPSVEAMNATREVDAINERREIELAADVDSVLDIDASHGAPGRARSGW